jgi:hypothetical protein
MYVLPKTIQLNPNDVISVGAQLSGTNGSQVIFTVTDQTTGVSTGSFVESTAVPCATDPYPVPAVNNNGVEWITERNGPNLANYGTENMSGWYCYRTPGNIQTQSGMLSNPFIAPANNVSTAINMTNGHYLSVVSEPTSNSSFTTTWKNTN